MIQATIIKQPIKNKLVTYFQAVLVLPMLYMTLKLIVIDWLAFSVLQ